MRVLGIETSCDETAAGVVGPDGILSDVTHTQSVHVAYGGVVPELASRAHAERIGATVAEALALSGIACKLEMLGVRCYASSGMPDDLYAEQGIDPASVVAAVKKLGASTKIN